MPVLVNRSDNQTPNSATLVPVAREVWHAQQSLKFPIFGDLGTRMTVVRLADKSVLLISPVKITESLKRDLAALGEITYVIAPNTTHHLFINLTRSIFPRIKIYGPAALGKKRRDIAFTDFLDTKKKYPWSEEFELFSFPGRGSFEEFAFFHRPTKTLIVTDLMMNLRPATSAAARLVTSMNGATKLGTTRIAKFIYNDRNAMKKNVSRFLELAPEKIILAHGQIVTENATEKLKESFGWLYGSSV